MEISLFFRRSVQAGKHAVQYGQSEDMRLKTEAGVFRLAP